MPYKHRQHVSFSFVEAKLFEVLPVKRIAIDQVSMDRVSRLERLYHCVQLLQHQENLAHLTATTPTISQSRGFELPQLFNPFICLCWQEERLLLPSNISGGR